MRVVTYIVEKDRESLEASLFEDDRRIELKYTNYRGDIQVGTYRDGIEVSTIATLCADGLFVGKKPIRTNRGSVLQGYLLAYKRLGPELREKIPEEWHQVLGRWLTLKERLN
jgi:hypothetical protein